MKVTKIKSIEHLKELGEDGSLLDCFVSLAGGAVRSSKEMQYTDNKWQVFNSIDGTMQTLEDKQLHSESNIGEAINKGCFFAVI